MIDFGNRQFGPTLDTQFGEKYTGTVIIPTAIVSAMIEAMPDPNNTGCIQMVIYKEEGVEIDIPYKPTREANPGGNNGAMDTQTTPAPPKPVGGISSYLIKPGNYSTYKYTEAQGTAIQELVRIDSNDKFYKLNVPGKYITYGDITNDGGGGNICINWNQGVNVTPKYEITGGGFASSFHQGSGTKTMFATSIVDKEFLYKYIYVGTEEQTLSVTNPNPTTDATSHMIVHKPVDGTYINYTLPDNNQSINPTQPINYNAVQAGMVDQMGKMSNGVWIPKEEGVYFVLARATNYGGGGSIQIQKSGGTVVGTGYKSGPGSITVTTFGLVNLTPNNTIAVYSPSGMEIKEVPITGRVGTTDLNEPEYGTDFIKVNTLGNFMIQKVDPNNIVSYILDNNSDTVLIPSATIPFSIKQLGNEDKLGSMNSGEWTCNVPGRYLIFADATNNSDEAVIKISVYYDAGGKTEIIGTGHATNNGTQTALTMGYANLSNKDKVSVQTLRNITNVTQTTVNSCHLLIYKVV
jgi:hypothetical protein